MYIFTRFFRRIHIVLFLALSMLCLSLCGAAVADTYQNAAAQISRTKIYHIYPVLHTSAAVRGFVNEVAGDSTYGGYDGIAVLMPSPSSIYGAPKIGSHSTGRIYKYGFSGSVSTMFSGVLAYGRDFLERDFIDRAGVAFVSEGGISPQKIHDRTATISIVGDEYRVVGGTVSVNSGTFSVNIIPLSTFFDAGYDVEYIAIKYSGTAGTDLKNELKEVYAKHFGRDGYRIEYESKSAQLTYLSVAFSMGYLVIAAIGLFNVYSLTFLISEGLSPTLRACRMAGGRMRHIFFSILVCLVSVLLAGVVLGFTIAPMLSIPITDVIVVTFGGIVPGISGVVLSCYAVTKGARLRTLTV